MKDCALEWRAPPVEQSQCSIYRPRSFLWTWHQRVIEKPQNLDEWKEDDMVQPYDTADVTNTSHVDTSDYWPRSRQLVTPYNQTRLQPQFHPIFRVDTLSCRNVQSWSDIKIWCMLIRHEHRSQIIGANRLLRNSMTNKVIEHWS